jgi:hypothetical protein
MASGWSATSLSAFIAEDAFLRACILGVDAQVATLRCGYCGGTGHGNSWGGHCPCCGGRGKTMLSFPVRRCAFCRGTGRSPRGSATSCAVCGGFGAFHMPDPVRRCNRCRGTGQGIPSTCTCISCSGRGIVNP